MNDANHQYVRPPSSSNADVQMDFRARAAAASEIMRLNLPAGMSLDRAGVSCCSLRRPSLSRFRGPIKVVAIASAILGLSGLAAGPILIYLHKGIAPGIALCCSIGGMLLCFFPTFFERWIVRRNLPPREDFPDSSARGIHVALEYAPTYGALKILAEDVGLIYIHPAARRVKISGLSYDYVIQSKDVVGLSLHSNGKTVLINYVVNGEQLNVAILPRSLLAELKRQTLGSDPSLFAAIRSALTMQS